MVDQMTQETNKASTSLISTWGGTIQQTLSPYINPLILKPRSNPSCEPADNSPAKEQNQTIPAGVETTAVHIVWQTTVLDDYA